MSLRVGILMGGASEEKKVSIATGKAVIKACAENGYTTTEFVFETNYKKYLKELKKQNIIFNALHGGIGENGKIQAWLDENDIKYTGSGAIASSLCMDKAKSKKIAKRNGIKTPDWQLIERLDQDVKITLPFVVKPNDQGSTVGLSIVKNDQSVQPAIDLAFQHGNKVIIEKFISGRELTIPIINEDAYPIVEINPKNNFYDYECKYTPGMSEYVCPADLEQNLIEKIETNTMKLFQKFDCSVYARADYILDKLGVPYFLEMNTLPGMTSTSLVPKSAYARGQSFQKLIRYIIELSI
ncbi:D-alanine--D-alanine ligase [bacterium]|nr:D-alanine--D-alanine ligase [bacterium]